MPKIPPPVLHLLHGLVLHLWHSKPYYIYPIYGKKLNCRKYCICPPYRRTMVFPLQPANTLMLMAVKIKTTTEIAARYDHGIKLL